ncbi:histidine ammonia-lyase [Thermosipho atlanticus]|uniref:Histidine ammonia-lyase n=1 Tax=Thermosipho atlanticus DSM 15807 TaxID=1123380 RepID=A0A1M5SR28_9BACT|nr:histidine ammonia-lyase [Thermosipho atlanticus]SHH40778.1 histidine ammonia-lyase [Thermosipho atlanticus DSM 15807]
MVRIDGNNLNLEEVHLVARKGEKVSLNENAKKKIEYSRKEIEKILESEKPLYGINTGFGALVKVRISEDKLEKLQRNIVLSHSAGVGEPLRKDIVRAMMLLRANSLAKGYSGVRVEVIEKILEFLNKDVYPYVPEKGSVGASGDLTPLAHVAMALIGEGYVLENGKKRKTNEILKLKKIKPLILKEKEGLSLLNGTQYITSILSLVIRDSIKLLEIATIIAAGSVDVLFGTPKAYDPRLQAARNHKGQKIIADLLRKYLEGSKVRTSHLNCNRVQDAYSLRAIPQVYGAVWDTLMYAKSVTLNEINASTDNPLVFDSDIISGGNFHGEPVALVADFVAIALTDLGNMIERRIDRLVNPMINEKLPPFLASGEEGLNSGYMIWQYTAAALCNENKVLSHPASVDSIPTSAYQEDHVSMGATSARKLLKIYENLLMLVSIEAMLTKVALENRRPLRSSPKIEEFFSKFDVELTGDRYFGDDFEKIMKILDSEINK